MCSGRNMLSRSLNSKLFFILLRPSIFFPIQEIGKKNNQSSISDADREMPTLGSTDNAGNSVNLVSGVIRFSLGLGFLGLHRRPMTDSIYLPNIKKNGE